MIDFSDLLSVACLMISFVWKNVHSDKTENSGKCDDQKIGQVMLYRSLFSCDSVDFNEN